MSVMLGTHRGCICRCDLYPVLLDWFKKPVPDMWVWSTHIRQRFFGAVSVFIRMRSFIKCLLRSFFGQGLDYAVVFSGGFGIVQAFVG